MGTRAAAVAALVGVWVLGWGEVSVGNVASGLVVALLVLALFPLGPIADRRGHTLRPIPTLRLAAYFVVELVLSNIAMARDLLGKRERIRTGVVAYPLRVDSVGLMTFLANVLSLSPGTMPIEFDDADDQPKVIYVHVTRMHERAETVRKIARYEELALQAFGSPAELDALAAAGPVTADGVRP
jgi:multicomponent Na+:H+ antiporter subunit E